MAVVNNTLKDSEYNFTSAAIISGKEEAASGWVTANYHTLKMKPLAVLHDPVSGSWRSC